MSKQTQQKKIFNCTFTAISLRGKKIARRFTDIKALDTYAAMDIVIERIGMSYANMIRPAFRFNEKPLKLSAAAKRITSNLTPDEE